MLLVTLLLMNRLSKTESAIFIYLMYFLHPKGPYFKNLFIFS